MWKWYKFVACIAFFPFSCFLFILLNCWKFMIIFLPLPFYNFLIATPSIRPLHQPIIYSSMYHHSMCKRTLYGLWVVCVVWLLSSIHKIVCFYWLGIKCCDNDWPLLLFFCCIYRIYERKEEVQSKSWIGIISGISNWYTSLSVVFPLRRKKSMLRLRSLLITLDIATPSLDKIWEWDVPGYGRAGGDVDKFEISEHLLCHYLLMFKRRHSI